MITLFCATNRPKNLTQIIVDVYAQLLKQHRIKFKTIYLEKICDGLDLNFWNPKAKKIEKEIIDSLEASDKIILVVPEYNGSFPGILKWVIDAIDPSNFRGKKVAFIGISAGRAGNIRGIDHLTSIFNHLGAIVFPNSLPISNIESLISDNKLADKVTSNMLEYHITNFLKF